MDISNHYIDFSDNAIFLEETKTLIISDTHIGMEEYIKKNGVLFPLNEKKELILRLNALIKSYNFV